MCHSLLPIGITLEPEDGEHLIDAVHHSGTIAVQDLVIGNVGSYKGRKFPVIAVGDQILNGCVIRTIALASLRFRAELVHEEYLRPEEFLVAGWLFTDLLGGDDLLFEQGPLCHDDRGPAQAGDFRDGPAWDFHWSFASPPETVDDRKEFLLSAVGPQVLPHKLVYGRERHHRYEGLRILSRSERR